MVRLNLFSKGIQRNTYFLRRAAFLSFGISFACHFTLKTSIALDNTANHKVNKKSEDEDFNIINEGKRLHDVPFDYKKHEFSNKGNGIVNKNKEEERNYRENDKESSKEVQASLNLAIKSNINENSIDSDKLNDKEEKKGLPDIVLDAGLKIQGTVIEEINKVKEAIIDEASKYQEKIKDIDKINNSVNEAFSEILSEAQNSLKVPKEIEDFKKDINEIKEGLQKEFESRTNDFLKFKDELEKNWEEIANNWPAGGSEAMSRLLDKAIENLYTYLIKNIDEKEALDRTKSLEIHPELSKTAIVRASSKLCHEELDFLKKRREVIHKNFAKFVGVDPSEIDPRDIPNIAFAGSGGGYRAMITSLGAMTAAKDSGLWDCFTHVAGVSGSCWFLYQYFTVGNQNFENIADHWRKRLSVDPAELSKFNEIAHSEASLPLLSGLMRKFNSDTPISLVDLFGTLLTSRLLIKDDLSGTPKLTWDHLKFSKQHDIIKEGHQPMPIYTTVRHELYESLDGTSESVKHQFQWFEFTPYEIGSSEFNLWIPTWSLGRKFDNGSDVSKVSELESGIYLGVFGSAFCATAAHILDEVGKNLPNPINQWYENVFKDYYDQMITVHPIAPTSFNNPFLNFNKETFLKNYSHLDPSSKLSKERDFDSMVNETFISFMDAGMDNNLPFYPLLRADREIDVIIAIDASDDIRTNKWFVKTDHYAEANKALRWPIGLDPWKQDVDRVFISEIDTDFKYTQTVPTTIVYFPLMYDPEYNNDFDPATEPFCSTFNFKYTADQIDLLLGLSKHQLEKSMDKIKESIIKAWECKKKKRLSKEEATPFNY